MMQFLKPKVLVGCDIGNSTVKFVRLKREGETFSLQSMGLIEADILGENEVVLNRVKAYFKECGLTGCRASINIEDESLRIRRMDLPYMPPNDLKVAIKWNLREYIDCPIEKYTVSYTGLDGVKVEGSDKHPILSYGVSSEVVDRLLKSTRFIGLKIASVEPNVTALLAAFDLNVGFEQGRYYSILDLGKGVANFAVVGNGKLLFSRPLNGVRCGDLKDVGQFLSQLVIEIQRSIDAFCLMFHAEKVENVFIAGEGSMVAGIGEYVSKNLGIDAKLFNPFEKIDTENVKEGIANAGLYAVAVGLALPRE